MRVLISIFLTMTIMTFSLTSCNNNTNTSSTDTMHDENGAVMADWFMYDTLSDITSSADFMVVAKVLSKGDAISIGYETSDFDNYSELVHSEPRIASMIKLSIRTPYKIQITDVISSNEKLLVGETLTLYQIGGAIGKVTLIDASTTPLEIGSEYVFILNKHTTANSTTYYYMVTPIQGYAKIEKSRSLFGTKNSFITNEDNHLFDSIKSTSDIYKALGLE